MQVQFFLKTDGELTKFDSLYEGAVALYDTAVARQKNAAQLDSFEYADWKTAVREAFRALKESKGGVLRLDQAFVIGLPDGLLVLYSPIHLTSPADGVIYRGSFDQVGWLRTEYVEPPCDGDHVAFCDRVHMFDCQACGLDIEGGEYFACVEVSASAHKECVVIS